MGKYGVNNDAPYPILWLKGTPNGDFITKNAVDFLPFDGKERGNTEHTNFRYSGNPDYSLSNLLQFLNSEDERWFSPTHIADTPPSRGSVDWGYMQYERHFGFLYHFEEYEVASSEKIGSSCSVKRASGPMAQKIWFVEEHKLALTTRRTSHFGCQIEAGITIMLHLYPEAALLTRRTRSTAAESGLSVRSRLKPQLPKVTMVSTT